MPKVDDYGYVIERNYDTDTFYQGYVKVSNSKVSHSFPMFPTHFPLIFNVFRNDESDSYVPDYEETESQTEVVTEVRI